MTGKSIFSPDYATKKQLQTIAGAEIGEYRAKITSNVSETAKRKGEQFSEEISRRFVADFEKKTDKMAHVSTFALINDTIYMTYYANCKEAAEDPNNQVARLAYCPCNDTENMTWLDVQAVGDDCSGRRIEMVYDTIFAQIDNKTLIILWTAKAEGNYYRFYRYFDIPTKTLGDVGVNRLKVGNITNDFSTSGIVSAFSENGIGLKQMYSDIGIMQKFTGREENVKTYFYTGAYSGDQNFIIKSRDFVTWEYVSQPDFLNLSKWENATYVLGERIYYFVRQADGDPCGFLTCYHIDSDSWEKPVLIEDCQSRSDFILYHGELYLFHAPIDREHIGVVRIDTEDLANSQVVLQANMHGSCFYPFIQYFGEELAMSYTVSREHIRLARFDFAKYCEA